ncbi:MAG: hypothetical protein K2P78_14555 [Gemmataceae bacterium]|nr:hypothetical protein [Gemmataceae bacterium]
MTAEPVAASISAAAKLWVVNGGAFEPEPDRPSWGVFWEPLSVRGSVRWLAPLGRHRQSHGPFYLWGNFPRFRCRVAAFKERLSSGRKAERAKVPYELSAAVAAACERSLEAVGMT